MGQKIKNLFKSAHSRNGSYSVGMIAIVIGIVVVVNLIVGQLPEKWRQIDISDNNLYTISKTSQNILSDLDKKVTITILAEKDNTDDRIKTFVSKYASLSKNVVVEWIDPVLHPSALTEYEVEENTIVVGCEETDKTDTITFDEIITYNQSAYYQTGSMQEQSFDAEGQLTAAINTVTNEVSKTVYHTTGHGEATLSESVTGLYDKSNLTDQEVNLLMQKEIPEDCDLLVMDGPTADISKDEKELLSSYIQTGGKVLILLGDVQDETPNFDALFKEYGLQHESGYIADMERCYQGNYFYIFPEISGSSQLTNGLDTEMVLMINSGGFTQVDAARDTIEVTPFLTTSTNGYLVTEEAQTQGTYIVGAIAEETVSGGSDDAESEEDAEDGEEASGEQTGTLTVIGSDSMIDSQITDQLTTLDNLTLFMNAITNNFSDVSNVSIKAKDLSMTYNTPTNTGALSLLLIFVIPVVILIGGFIAWYRRRKA